MDHNDLQPDWDRDDLSRRAALDARLQAMLIEHLADDPLWPRTMTGLEHDLVEHDEVLAMLNRFCVVVENQAILLYGGRQEALDAFKRNLVQLRHIATKGAVVVTIPNMPPQQLERAAEGTDPRGWLAFDAPLPDPFRPPKTPLQCATATKHGCSSHAATHGPPQRPRSRCCSHLGLTVPEGLETVVSWPSRACRRRTWPALETRRYDMTEPTPRTRRAETHLSLGGGRFRRRRFELTRRCTGGPAKLRRRIRICAPGCTMRGAEVGAAAAARRHHQRAEVERIAAEHSSSRRISSGAPRPDGVRRRAVSRPIIGDRVVETAKRLAARNHISAADHAPPPSERPIEGLRGGASPSRGRPRSPGLRRCGAVNSTQRVGLVPAPLLRPGRRWNPSVVFVCLPRI